ncbi:MAG: LysR family transcriptional regulator [Oscillospiraceae bacterium]
MNFMQLTYFKTVVESGSMVKASSALYVSQPTLSFNISNLEHELGSPLFNRINSRLVLTEYGEYFYNLTLKMLSIWQSCLDTEEKSTNDSKISIVIDNVSIPYSAILYLISSFNGKKEIKFHIHSQSTFLSDALSDDINCDILLSSEKVYASRFPYHHVIDTQKSSLQILLPKSSSLYDRSSIELSDLRNIDFCVLKEGAQYEVGVHYCLDHGFMPKCCMIVNNVDFKLLILSQGTLAGFVPNNISSDYDSIKDTRLIPCNVKHRSPSMCIYWSETANGSPIAMECIDVLKKYVENNN